MTDSEKITAGSMEATKSAPDVSIVVPTYNRLDILPRCLDALAAQTHPSHELIVVDDGSTDGTREFLQDFAARSGKLQFRWVANERNSGSNATRNHGVREARGRLIGFIDSDCIARPDWVEKITAVFDDPGVGSATGGNEIPEPRNIYDLTMRGTNRVPGREQASRLVGGNMCIRRELVTRYSLDTDLRYGCDEEGLYRKLKALGYRQMIVRDAVVTHEHFYNRQTFFRQARIGGSAAAWLVYKYHLPPRLDVSPFILMHVSLLLGLLDVRLLAVPVLFLAAGLAALMYGELRLKRKTLGEALRSFHMLVAYYQVRVWGYVAQTFRLYFLPHQIERIRLSRWKEVQSPSRDPDG